MLTLEDFLVHNIRPFWRERTLAFIRDTIGKMEFVDLVMLDLLDLVVRERIE